MNNSNVTITPILHQSQQDQQQTVIKQLWHLMTEIYDHKWTTKHGSSPHYKDLWVSQFQNVTIAQLNTGIQRLLTTTDRQLQQWPPTLMQFYQMCTAKYDLPTLDEAWREAVSVIPAHGDKYSHITIERAVKLTNYQALNHETLGSNPKANYFLKPKFTYFYQQQCHNYDGGHTPPIEIDDEHSNSYLKAQSQTQAQDLAQSTILEICKAQRLTVIEALTVFTEIFFHDDHHQHSPASNHSKRQDNYSSNAEDKTAHKHLFQQYQQPNFNLCDVAKLGQFAHEQEQLRCKVLAHGFDYYGDPKAVGRYCLKYEIKLHQKIDELHVQTTKPQQDFHTIKSKLLSQYEIHK